tara:strand:+ start:26267 stop:26848 length:582 start_codon:yes stop_codon:yes gene_type:complete
MDYKRNTIDVYNKDAEKLAIKFEKLLELHRRFEFPKFIELLNGKKVLDLGCGAGEHSLFFKEKGLEITAIDLSERMIELCKDKGINAQVMDIENLEYADQSFDGIWAVTSLLHIPKEGLSKVISKLNAILKSEGILYVCVKEGEGAEIVDDGRFFQYWQMHDLIKQFNGFEVLFTEKEHVGTRTFLEIFFRKL